MTLSCRENLRIVCKSSFPSASINKLSNPWKCSSCHFLTVLRRGIALKSKVERRVSIWFSPFSQALVLSSPWKVFPISCLRCFLFLHVFWKVFPISSVACQWQHWVICSWQHSSCQSGRSRKAIRCTHLFFCGCTECSRLPSFLQGSWRPRVCRHCSIHITDKCDDSSCLCSQTARTAERFMNLLILKGIINGSCQASMLYNTKMYYLCSSKQARVRGAQRGCQQQKWAVLQDCADCYHSYCMSFMWTFLAARFSQAILTGVFNVGHQGAAALHVVLYNWVASTFHRPILGLTKSWAGRLSSRNVLFHKQSYSPIFSHVTHTHICLSQPVSEAFPHSILSSS